ncbi:CPCC family cysteine-rich protein [Bradyrhizobium sp. SZCCHNS30582]|uniref:CPCC family cysteine-rich protein n=1 Tax=unclassified Bradyrhizobium TaxID=2631580 RepID=UPI003966E3A3
MSPSRRRRCAIAARAAASSPLGERGGFEICPVCYWEDDGQDDHDADLVRGGPNGALSLTEARANFKTHGASEAAHRACVRPPADDER